MFPTLPAQQALACILIPNLFTVSYTNVRLGFTPKASHVQIRYVMDKGASQRSTGDYELELN